MCVPVRSLKPIAATAQRTPYHQKPTIIHVCECDKNKVQHKREMN